MYTKVFFLFKNNDLKSTTNWGKKGCFCPHYPFIKPSLDCTFPRSSIFNQRLCWLVPWKISLYVCAYSVSVLCAFFVSFLWLLFVWSVSKVFMGQCGRPTACLSACYWGCAGPAAAGGVWKRGRCHLDDGELSVSAGHGSDPPVAAPQHGCLRCQNGLRGRVDARVSVMAHWESVTSLRILSIFLPAETSTTAMKRAISSGSRPREPSFSLNSNIASSKEPIPKALRVAKE